MRVPTARPIFPPSPTVHHDQAKPDQYHLASSGSSTRTGDCCCGALSLFQADCCVGHKTRVAPEFARTPKNQQSHLGPVWESQCELWCRNFFPPGRKYQPIRARLWMTVGGLRDCAGSGGSQLGHQTSVRNVLDRGDLPPGRFAMPCASCAQ